MRKFILVCMFVILLAGTVLAYDFDPQRNITLRDKYSINSGVIIESEQFCTGSECGNITDFLTGGSVGNASFNQTLTDILYTNQTYVDSENANQTSWINSIFLKIADMFTKQNIIDMIYGNRTEIETNTNSAITGNYSELNNIIISVNNTNNIMSIGFYNESEVDALLLLAGNSSFNESYTDTKYYLLTNPDNYINLTTGQVFNDTALILSVNETTNIQSLLSGEDLTLNELIVSMLNLTGDAYGGGNEFFDLSSVHTNELCLGSPEDCKTTWTFDNPFDQSLNTTEYVTFAGANISSLIMKGDWISESDGYMSGNEINEVSQICFSDSTCISSGTSNISLTAGEGILITGGTNVSVQIKENDGLKFDSSLLTIAYNDSIFVMRDNLFDLLKTYIVDLQSGDNFLLVSGNDNKTITLNQTKIDEEIVSVGLDSGFNSTYNATYDEFAYNQTLPANDYTDNQISSLNNSVVHTDGDESINGTKTFLQIPVLPSESPTTDNQAVRKKYVDDALTGLTWKEPVINFTNTEPSNPTLGDRYIITAIATGNWTGNEDNVTTYNGTDWTFEGPEAGWALLDLDSNAGYTYPGNNGWVIFSGGTPYISGDGIDISGTTISADPDLSTIGFIGSKLAIIIDYLKDAFSPDGSIIISGTNNKSLQVNGTWINDSIDAKLSGFQSGVNILNESGLLQQATNLTIVGSGVVLTNSSDGVTLNISGSSSGEGAPVNFTYAIFEAYNNEEQTVTNAQTEVTLGIEKRKNTDYYSHSTSINKGQVTVLKDGLYKISSEGSVYSVDLAGGARGGPTMIIQKDTGTGFENIEGAVARDYIRETTNLGAHVSKTIYEELSAGDIIRITISDVIAVEPNEKTLNNSFSMILEYLNVTGNSGVQYINGTTVDTNASTACDGDEVLLGNASCMSSSNFGGGSGVGKIGSSPELYNNTDTMFLNGTWFNESVNALISGGAEVTSTITFRELMWAEENSVLDDNSYEWAFGNGANAVKGPTMAYDGTLKNIGLSCQTAGTATNVTLRVNSADVACSVSMTGNTATNTCDVDFSAGDTITAYTKVAGSASTCQVSWWIEYSYQAVINGDFNSFLNITDTPNSYSGASGQCIAVNSSESGLEFTACGSGGSGISGINISDGTEVINTATQLNFTGSGIILTNSSNGVVVVEISGGSGGSDLTFDHAIFHGKALDAMTITNSDQVIELNSEEITDSSYYTHSNSVSPEEVEIVQDGVYLINAEATVKIIDTAGGARGAPRLALQLDTGTGFVEIDGAFSQEYTREYTPVSGYMAITKPLSLNSGDKLRMVIKDAMADEPNEQIEPNSSRLTIQTFSVSGGLTGSSLWTNDSYTTFLNESFPQNINITGNASIGSVVGATAFNVIGNSIFNGILTANNYGFDNPFSGGLGTEIIPAGQVYAGRGIFNNITSFDGFEDYLEVIGHLALDDGVSDGIRILIEGPENQLLKIISSTLNDGLLIGPIGDGRSIISWNAENKLQFGYTNLTTPSYFNATINMNKTDTEFYTNAMFNKTIELNGTKIDDWSDISGSEIDYTNIALTNKSNTFTENQNFTQNITMGNGVIYWNGSSLIIGVN